MSNLAGKVALVTGLLKGIGLVIAVRLAQAGATVAINYGHSADAANEAVAKIKQGGG